jgi:redox-sensitive bicupin YhaK (pirin superfamily)
VSNLEKDPAMVALAEPSAGVLVDAQASGSLEAQASAPGSVEILLPRDVPLGGPRALPVRRTLPQRGRNLIGAWCFVDHYGPVAADSMIVPPHPHTGLQTVSWLFAGEIDHRDSVGSHATVRPGELNLMTAGSGIQHSEVSLPDADSAPAPLLHGAQLWIALPDSDRGREPFFERFVPQPFDFHGATVSAFLGDLLGRSSTATTFTRVVGAQLDVPAGASIELPVDPTFEHGILVDAGEPTIEGSQVAYAQVAYLAPGRASIRIESGATPLRALLIGGVPLGEQIVMWWNFIGRSHDEIVEFRRQWQAEVISRETPTATGRFGAIHGYDGGALPAPELPNVRLKPRE